MNLVKGIAVGGSVVLAFIAGMVTMFRLSEHYQRIVRYWIERKAEWDRLNIYDDEDKPQTRPPRRRPPKKAVEPKADDVLEVKTDV